MIGNKIANRITKLSKHSQQNNLFLFPNQPTKFWTKNWVEINDDVHGMYKENSQIKFKTSMVKSILCDYSDAYILVSGTITIDEEGADDNAKILDKRNKEPICKSFAPFTDWKSEIDNTQIDNKKDIDVVMTMYNIIEYSDNYSKTLGSLRQNFRDGPNDNITQSELFKSKIKITGKTLLMVIRKMLKQQKILK